MDRSKPWLTWFVMTIYLIIFLIMQFENNPITVVLESSDRLFTPDSIWRGNLLWPIVSTFIHYKDWHFAGNFSWMFVLGGLLEREIGRFRWMLFYISSALISSIAQLAMSNDVGIGASGVIYAMFGFMWVTRRIYTRFQVIAAKATLYLLVGWLIVGIYLTESGFFNIGNTAHFAGFVYGLVVGAIIALKKGKESPSE